MHAELGTGILSGSLSVWSALDSCAVRNAECKRAGQDCGFQLFVVALHGVEEAKGYRKASQGQISSVVEREKICVVHFAAAYHASGHQLASSQVACAKRGSDSFSIGCCVPSAIRADRSYFRKSCAAALVPKACRGRVSRVVDARLSDVLAEWTRSLRNCTLVLSRAHSVCKFVGEERCGQRNPGL